MLEAIRKRWDTVPPASVSIAAIARGLGGKTTSEKVNDEAGFNALQNAVAQMGFAGGKPEWLKAAEAKT